MIKHCVSYKNSLNHKYKSDFVKSIVTTYIALVTRPDIDKVTLEKHFKIDYTTIFYHCNQLWK